VDCGRDWFTVALIPETVKRTALAGMKAGDAVNLEADPIGRYVARALAQRQDDGRLARFAQEGWTDGEES
jgi:riboflavin synthase